MLIICGSILALVWAAGAAVPAGPSGPRDDRAMTAGFAILLGAGTGTLSIGRAPLGGPFTRIGLGLVSLGLFGAALGTVITAGGEALLESLPALILLFGGGLLAILGWFLTGISLVQSEGAPRIVGAIVLVGVLTVFIPLLGYVIVTAGFGAIGLLALRGRAPDRDRPV